MKTERSAPGKVVPTAVMPIETAVFAGICDSARIRDGAATTAVFPPSNGPLVNGYWDYFGDFTNYILNNVCQSTVCH